MLSTNDNMKTGERKEKVRFGQLLVSKGLLKDYDLEDALREQTNKGGRLGEVLVRLKKLSDQQVTEALSEHLSTEYVRIDINEIDSNTARLVPEIIAKRFNLIAIGRNENKLIVAMNDPLDIIAIDTITFKTKYEVHPVLSSTEEIRNAIELIYHGSDVEEQHLRDLVELEVGNDEEFNHDAIIEGALEADISVEEAATKAPVIRFVNLLLRQAVKSRASDIHVEPQEQSMTIRMRIDGVLCDMVPPSRKMQAAVATRIKILSKMDIAERRLPQDGRFRIKAPGRDIDVRVSVIPTIYGEKVVMRILDSSAINHDIDQLGFEPELLKQYKQILKRPHGIVIVTGPTGSGKSTTLYSSLNYIRDPKKNITTVEDPVEYRLAGINQIQVKPEIDLDFGLSLRAILRQDPDIIFIGEIRDKETIDIAIKASLTGHLVLSTFHTNDAPSAISRMVYMGVQPYLLASTVNLIIAQRLVRRICEHCKEPLEMDDETRQKLEITTKLPENAVVYHGKGCNACGNTGYFGRLPIFEFLIVDKEIRKELISGAEESRIREISRRKGYHGLFESGINRVLNGLTTPEEIFGATVIEDEGA